MRSKWAAAALLLLAAAAWGQTAQPLVDLSTARSPLPGRGVSGMRALGEKVVFSANTRRGAELWVSDGTGAGTFPLADLAVGEASANPALLEEIGGLLLFTATDAAGVRLLCATDGTPEGTRVLLRAQFISSAALSGDGAWLALWTRVGFGQWRLVFTDGTPGSVRLLTPPPGLPTTTPLLVARGLGNRVFLLSTNVGGAGATLWESDGTEAGTLMRPVSIPGEVLTWQKGLDRPLFVSRQAPFLPVQMWATDGTLAGTELLLTAPLQQSFFNGVTTAVAGGVLALRAAPNLGGYASLYLSNGTASSLREVLSLGADVGVASLGSRFLVAVRGGADTSLSLLEPSSGANVPLLSRRGQVTGMTDGTVRSFASIFEQPYQGAGRLGLWAIEATGEVTRVLQPAELTGATTSPSGVGWFGLRELDANDRNALWRSEGTPESTRRVAEVNPGNDGSNPVPVGRAGASVLMTTNDDRLVAVWANERTAEVLLLRDAGVALQGAAVSVGRYAVFPAWTAAFGAEPWVTDGTAKGTRLLRDISPQLTGAAPRAFARVGERLLFSADDLRNGDEPWVTDGTSEGTGLLADVRPGAGGSVIGEPAVAGGKAYFSADDGLSGRELWATDGTPGGTARVADLVPGPAGSAPSQVTAMGPNVVWVAKGPSSEEALWLLEPGGQPRPAATAGAGAAGSQPVIVRASDLGLLFTAGTPRAWYGLTLDAGVTALTTLPDPSALLGGASTSGFAALRFRAPDAGTEVLWASTGAPAQTVGLGGFTPLQNLTAVGPLAFFAAGSIDSGTELWVTDGTRAGTRQYVDVASDALSSSPGPVTWVGKWLAFAATGDTFDREPWRVDLPAGFDNTPPEVRGSVEGPRTDGGWLTGDGTVRFTVEDPDSPIQSAVGCAEVHITEDTAGQAFSCTARSLGGEAGATVTVKRDTTPPVLRCPDGGSFESADGGPLRLDLGTPSATDALDPAPHITVEGGLQGEFPVGRTTVRVKATDEAGGLSQCTVDVEVTLARGDLSPPSAPAACGCAASVPGGFFGLLALLALQRRRRASLQ